MSTPLPTFEDPPLVEVVLGVQFDPLQRLRTPQLGLLWQEFKSTLPLVEEKPPLEPTFERFGTVRKATESPSFQILEAPPVPRVWFKNETGTELIQLQADRFIHNWRKVDDGNHYPRYEKLRSAFAQELAKFVEFIKREKLDEFVPNQCEVTYVNHIVAGNGWDVHGELCKVLSVFSGEYTDSFLGMPEEARLMLRFTIPNGSGEPIGRLHVSAEPAYRRSDDQQMYRLSLTARGLPFDGDVDGVLKFLDIGREWVVRGFASITTREMHRIWRRSDA